LKKEEAISLRRGQVNFEQGMIALTDKKMAKEAILQ